MRKPKKLTYPRFGNRTVSVGDVLTLKWPNGETEKFTVTGFSPISNQPQSADRAFIPLDFVVWDSDPK